MTLWRKYVKKNDIETKQEISRRYWHDISPLKFNHIGLQERKKQKTIKELLVIRFAGGRSSSSYYVLQV